MSKEFIGKNTSIKESEIGNYTTIGENCKILYSNIGKYCSISWNVNIGIPNHTINTITTHNFIHSSFYGFIDEYRTLEITTKIGHDVWIGLGSAVLAGVKIGNGSIIGANSVVIKDIEPYSIYAGSPAKFIRYRFDEKIINLLKNLQWWNLDDKFIKSNIQLFSIENLDESTLLKLLKLKKDYLEK